MQILLKALSSKFTVVERARSKFISVSSESKPNSDSSDEKEMILKQNLDVLVPKYLGTINFVFHFLEQIQRTEAPLCLVPGTSSATAAPDSLKRGRVTLRARL